MTEEFIDLSLEDEGSNATELEIEIDEGIGWVADTTVPKHANLPDRNDSDQHTIDSITNLRAELDEIERLKTVYSDKPGVANYYEWNSDTPEEQREAGYFVSRALKSLKIKLCEGSDIFGVTVKKEDVGFIGNADTTPRGSNYGLVVTSGVVDVRCASGINEGDYVVANSAGIAIKTESDCGYRVISKVIKDNVEYVSISLGVQACTTNLLGQRVGGLEERLKDAEINIAAARNAANEAALKAGMSNTTSNETQEKVDQIIDATNDMKDAINDSLKILEESARVAEDAAKRADEFAGQAVSAANSALAKAGELETTVNLIDDWEYEDPETGEAYKGAEYFAEYVEHGLKTKASLETVEKYNENNLLLIEQNAESYNRIIASVDKYCIGEYAQSYGLSVDQARKILKRGMIYIPYPNTHTETYVYETEDETYTITQDFIKNWYYEWEKTTVVSDTGKEISGYWWRGVEKKVWDSTTNPSGMAYEFWFDNNTLYKLEENHWVEFDKEIWTEDDEPTSDYDYWFNDNVVKVRLTDGDGVVTWISYDTATTETQPTSSAYDFWYNDEKFYTQWIEVNTLAGNVNSRIQSMIRQDVDKITEEVVNACGSVAGFGKWITDTESVTHQLTQWKNKEGTNCASIYTQATDNGSEVVIGALVEDKEGNLVEGATLKLEVAKDEDGNPTSNLKIAADSVDFTAEDYSVIADNVKFTTEEYALIADQIELTTEEYALIAEQVKLTAEDYDVIAGKVKFNTEEYALIADQIELTTEEYALIADQVELTADDYALIADNINMSAGVVNLVEEYGIEHASSSYLIYNGYYLSPHTSSNDYLAGWGLNNPKVGCLVPEQTYTAQIDVTPGKDVESIKLLVSGGNMGVCTIPVDISQGRQIVKQTFKFTNYANGLTPIDDYSNGKILIYRWPNNIENPTNTTIHRIKIEEGSTATSWDNANNINTSAGIINLVADYSAKYAGENYLIYNGYFLIPHPSSNDYLESIGVGNPNFGCLVPGQTYTVQMDVTPGKDVTAIKLRAAGDQANLCDMLVDVNRGRQIVKKTFKFTDYPEGYNPKEDYLNSRIVVYRLPQNIESPTETTVHRIKIEEGPTATSWDADKSNFSSDTMNWRMLPDKCVWWNQDTSASNPLMRLDKDGLYIKGEVEAAAGTIGGWEIGPYLISSQTKDGDVVTGKIELSSSTGNYWIWASGMEHNELKRRFAVLKDGTLYATDADITGKIVASEGRIGDVHIFSGGLKYDVRGTTSSDYDVVTEAYKLDKSGLTMFYSDSQIKVGDVTLKYDADKQATLFETSNALILQGQNETQLKFMSNDAESERSLTVSLYCKNVYDAFNNSFYVYLDVGESECLYDTTVGITCQYANSFGAIIHEETKYITLRAGTSQSPAELFYHSADIAELNTDTIRFKNSWGGWSSWVGVSNYYMEVCEVAKITQKQQNNYIEIKGHLIPIEDSETQGQGYNLGIATRKWDNVYARNGVIETSDGREKQDIYSLSDSYEQVFDALQPVSYKFIVNTSNRTHTGFIAQEVKSAVESAGLTTQDFAGYCEWDEGDGQIGCGLRYGEFVSLNTWQIQKLKPRVSTLEEKVQALEIENTELKEQIQLLLEK